MNCVKNGLWTLLNIIIYCVLIQLSVIFSSADVIKNIKRSVIELLWELYIPVIIFSNINNELSTTNNGYVLPVKLRVLVFTATTQNLCYTYLHNTVIHKRLIINLCSYTYTCGKVDTIQGKLLPLCTRTTLPNILIPRANIQSILINGKQSVKWSACALCLLYPPRVNESLAPRIKVRMTCNLLIDFMHYVCKIACIMICNSILKVFYFMILAYFIIPRRNIITQLNYMIQYNDSQNFDADLIYLCLPGKYFVHKLIQYINYRRCAYNRNNIKNNKKYSNVQERLLMICMIFISPRQQLLSEQCTTNAVIIGYCNEQIYYLYMYRLELGNG